MFGNLYSSSAVFVHYIKELHTKFFENIITQTNIVQKFMQILSTIQFFHPCDFPNIYFLKLFIKIRLYFIICYYMLKFINRNLKTKKRNNKKPIILYPK